LGEKTPKKIGWKRGFEHHAILATSPAAGQQATTAVSDANARATAAAATSNSEFSLGYISFACDCSVQVR
jgi:hypothetical protein